tara:strand:- start:1040 stop:1303 length:264 start_codon:yes stop_codon:yes gene_type:complete
MIMQKIINVLALASFAVSAGVVSGGTYVYVNRDSITDNIKGQIEKALTEAVLGEAVPTNLPGGDGLNSGVPGVSGDTSGASIPAVPF